MNKKILFAVGIALLVCVIAAAAVLYPHLSKKAGPVVPVATLSPDAAPDFTVYDMEGNPVKLSDLAGKPVVVNMWATWCGPCRSELPAFNACEEEMKDTVTFLMIDLDEDPDTILAFASENGYTFDLYCDTDFSAAAAYGVTAIPRTLLINADGTLAGDHIGSINEQMLREGIAMITE